MASQCPQQGEYGINMQKQNKKRGPGSVLDPVDAVPEAGGSAVTGFRGSAASRFPLLYFTRYLGGPWRLCGNHTSSCPMSDDEEVLEMNANGTFDFDATSAMNKHNWQTNEAAHPPSPPIAKKNIQGNGEDTVLALFTIVFLLVWLLGLVSPALTQGCVSILMILYICSFIR
jgi:hypothetical protein